MAKSSPRPANPIDALLEERERFQTWLNRLDEAGSTAPAAVRAKIRGDYQRRLEQVVEQLRSHAAAVAEQLASLRVQQADLTQREVEAQETLAEAELRHAVGEYEESEWERVRGGSERLLIDVREELARVSDEIARLGEVQGLIAGPPPPPPPVAAAPPAAAPAPGAGGRWHRLGAGDPAGRARRRQAGARHAERAAVHAPRRCEVVGADAASDAPVPRSGGAVAG